MNRYLTAFLFITLMFHCFSVQSSPTGEDVYRACLNYQQKSNQNTVGDMLCYWYVTPCDCAYLPKELPRVCIPADVDESDLIRRFIEGYEANTSIAEQDAQMAVNIILSDYFPCDNHE